ncbi:MAG TPA: hypothetical protein VHF58_10850 [Solirubrobacterales bacterium]|nr:hypothetical protein [Solirubrobacterales bacterium]
MGLAPGSDAAFASVAGRVRELLASYRPPDFGHVPDPDAALFLCAVDHKSGYVGSHMVDGAGPFRGSALMWAVGLRVARERDGDWLTARRLVEVTAEEVAEAFRIEGETVRDPERRASLWRDLAAGLLRDHKGSAARLNDAAGARLGEQGGLLHLLSRYEAFADPLAKKAQLYAKICERRGWVTVTDPEHWEVSADSVLMRLALRSGLVAAGELDDVRAATRDAFRRVAREAEVSPPVLDDLLWERGREDPDLLGSEGGDVREPPRDPESAYY